jgi:serine/threonine-protein kinase
MLKEVTGRSEHPYYELLEPCGEGGMGVVYKARDKRLNRIVALKFLAPDRAGQKDAVRRFEREARAIAALNHPNIAVVYDVGEWDGTPFLALEYLPGGTLKSRCRGRRLPYTEILHYVTQLGKGLSYAHDQGILHRDIKPSNVMFSEHGDLKLVDFGLAKWRNADDATRTGAMVGTLPYMAPELLDGEDATAQTDVYALGALVYELASGQPMFGGERTEVVIRKIVTGDSPALHSVRPDLPPHIASQVARATARNPKERYGSVRESLRDLSSGAESGHAGFSEMKTETMPVPQSRTATPHRGRPIWAYAAAAVLALAAGVYGIAHFVRAPAALKTLVVLPLDNLNHDPESQAFADGLQETITDTLAQAGTLRNSMLVVPSTEVKRNQIRTISDARKQFNANLVITGAVEKDPNELKLTLNLADAQSLRQEATRVVEVKPAEMAGLPDRLSEELGALLNTGSMERAGGSAPGETTRNSSAYQLYVQGKGALQNREWDTAADDLRKAVDLDPKFALARTALSESYMRKYMDTKDAKWLALADAELTEAARQGQTPRVAFVQAMIWSATGQTERAIPLFRQFVQTDPDNMEVRHALAQALEAAGQIPEAEAAYQAAVRRRPGYWLTYQLLGLFYSRHEGNAKAVQTYLTGIAVAPGIPALHSNLGAVYLDMGKSDEAAGEFQKSVALKPIAASYSNLGIIQFYQGRFQEAAAQFEAATKLQPANPLLWGNLGDAQWQIPGEREHAREAFDKAAVLVNQDLALSPGKVNLRRCYALYLAKLGRSKEALAETARTLEQAPKDKNVQYWAARVYADTGDLTRAQAALRSALALGYDKRTAEREPDLAQLVLKQPGN